MRFDYAVWPYVAERPEYRLLRLADIGAREVHYDFARRGEYVGHFGGSMICPHEDCAAVAAEIKRAVEREE